MTEGTINIWKLKEGDTFSAGDVLLEIETDKAQMDVEATDDGILARIMVGAGTKAVQVGSQIAVLAEPGDDLTSLKMPPEDKDTKGGGGASAQEQRVDGKSPRQSTGSSMKEDRPSDVKSSATSAPGVAGTRKMYTASPSVAHLIREHGISELNVSAINATGPKGRLLKGDVLAYLGIINEAHIKELEGRIHKLEKLDLSNIKIASPKKDVAEKAKQAEKKPAVDEETELKLEVSFGEVLKAQNKFQSNFHPSLSLCIKKKKYKEKR